MLKLGDVFINRNLGSPPLPWVIVAVLPDGTAIGFVVEPIGRKPYEATCLIRESDLPCVSRPSFVNYELGHAFTAADQQKLRDGSYCDFQAVIAPEVLKRIQQGALDSDFTPQKLQRVLAESLRTSGISKRG